MTENQYDELETCIYQKAFHSVDVQECTSVVRKWLIMQYKLVKSQPKIKAALRLDLITNYLKKEKKKRNKTDIDVEAELILKSKPWVVKIYNTKLKQLELDKQLIEQDLQHNSPKHRNHHSKHEHHHQHTHHHSHHHNSQHQHHEHYHQHHSNHHNQ